MYEKDDRIITDRDVYSVRYDRQASPSLPFPNTSLPLPAPLACISSTHSPRRFVLCVFRPLRSFALAVRFASSCSRERETEMEGRRRRRTERRGKRVKDLSPPILLLSFASLSLSLTLSPFFSNASYSRYAFRHTPRVATILLPSFVSSFPSRFSPRSLLRFVIFVTVSACPNGKQRATLPVGRYFSSP